MNVYEAGLRPHCLFTDQALAKLAKWQKGEVEGISTGFPTLDNFIRMSGSRLYTIAARPGMGKTSLGVQMMANMALSLARNDDEGQVVFFSAEMTGESIAARWAAMQSNTNIHSLASGKGTEVEYQQYGDALHRNRDLRMYTDETAAPTTEYMLEEMERLNASYPVRAMLFDFMELGGDRGSSEERRISGIAIALKDIAKQMNIPVIAISQLNRMSSSRADRMPSLTDLRHSGQIEQISDAVILIMRPEYYVLQGEDIEVDDPADVKGVAYVIIAKNRHGPTGQIKLHFNSAAIKFGELEMERTHLNETQGHA